MIEESVRISYSSSSKVLLVKIGIKERVRVMLFSSLSLLGPEDPACTRNNWSISGNVPLPETDS